MPCAAARPSICVLVCLAEVDDRGTYDVTYAWFQEIYMNHREANPQGYNEQSSAINFAEGPQGDLLMIHGTGETNTHLEIIEGLVDRLIELGKPFVRNGPPPTPRHQCDPYCLRLINLCGACSCRKYFKIGRNAATGVLDLVHGLSEQRPRDPRRQRHFFMRMHMARYLVKHVRPGPELQ
eukprot:SAG25_NODE_245_length_11100_cov_4.621671_5_plen_180_part_00